MKTLYSAESDLDAFLLWTVEIEIFSDDQKLPAASREQIGRFLEHWLAKQQSESGSGGESSDKQLLFIAQLLSAVYWRIEGELEKALDCTVLAVSNVEHLFETAAVMFDGERSEDVQHNDVQNALWRFANELFVTVNGHDLELRKLRALPRVQLAGTLTSVQRVALAERQLDEALEAFPEAPLVHFARANLFAMRRDWSHAKRAYLDSLARSGALFTAALDRLRYLLCVTDRLAERSH